MSVVKRFIRSRWQLLVILSFILATYAFINVSLFTQRTEQLQDIIQSELQLNNLVEKIIQNVSNDKIEGDSTTNFNKVFNGEILHGYDLEINNKKCSNEYGEGLIHRWQHSRIDICSGFGNSSISCYKRDIHATDRMFCTAEFIQLETQKPFYTYDHTNLSKESRYNFKDGSLKVDCQLSMYNWVPKVYWDKFTLGNMQISKASI